MAPVLVDAQDPRPGPQAGRLRQQVRGCTSSSTARTGRRRWASTSARCPRSRGRRPGRPSRSRARAAGSRHGVGRPAAGHRHSRRPEPSGAELQEGCALRPALGRSRSSPSRATAAGRDWNHQSFSHSTGLVYTGYGYVAAAHSLTESSNGLRPPGEYMTGGIVAVDPRHEPGPVAQAHAVLAGPRQRHPDHRTAICCSSASRTATCCAWTPATGASCGGSRPGPRSAAARSCMRWTASSTSRSTPAAPASPTANSRAARATTCGRSRSAAPSTSYPLLRRRSSAGRSHGTGPVEGSLVNNTVVLARTYNANTGDRSADGVRPRSTRWRPPICGSRWARRSRSSTPRTTPNTTARRSSSKGSSTSCWHQASRSSTRFD